MNEEKKKSAWWEGKVKRWTIICVCLISFSSAITAVGAIGRKAWGLAQRAEVYGGLPDRLDRFENRAIENGKKLDALDKKVDDLINELRHRNHINRRGDTEATNGSE